MTQQDRRRLRTIMKFRGVVRIGTRCGVVCVVCDERMTPREAGHVRQSIRTIWPYALVVMDTETQDSSRAKGVD